MVMLSLQVANEWNSETNDWNPLEFTISKLNKINKDKFIRKNVYLFVLKNIQQARIHGTHLRCQKL